MNLIKLCVDRPVGVSVGVLLLIFFGLLALFALPVQLTPNVDIPVVQIQTLWNGANPQEVEQEIIDKQEEQLRSVKGLKKMTSSSGDNMGTVTLEFYNGVDKAEAMREVNDKLRQVSDYPIEVDQPTVALQDPAVDSPIAWLILHPTSGDDAHMPELYDFAEDNIKPYLDRVRGVASVKIYGGREREVRVDVDAGKLAARSLTFRQVQTALRLQNANISAGSRAEGKREYAIRTVGQYQSIDEILSTVVAYTSGGPVYVRDIASVSNAFARQRSFVRSKGQNVLALPVTREVGTNVIEVMDGVKAAIAKINQEVLTGRDLKLELEQVYDETIYINQAIGMVQSNAIYGTILTIIVLMAFLRNARATLAVALAIPISVIGTFVVIVAMGRTLNVISIAGIAFAIGMVVDNSIVVLENIFRHRESGKPMLRACVEGASEVWAAVLASTLTTIIVFIPVIFVREEAGQLFRDISIATVVSVSLSLLVSVTVLPVLAHTLLRNTHLKGDTFGGEIATLDRARLGFFGRIIDFVGRSRLASAAIPLAITLASLGLVPLLTPDATYLPAGNRNLVFGFLLTPPGYSLDEFKRMGTVVEAVIAPYWQAAPGSPEQKALDERWIKQVEGMLAANAIPELSADAGGGMLQRDRTRREWLTPPPLTDNFFFVAFNGGCFMGASSRDPMRVKPLVRLLQTSGGLIPGTYPIFFQTSLFSFGGGNTAEIEIRGDDLDKVNSSAAAVRMACMQKFGFVQANPSNFDLGRPEVRYLPDREKAADLGMNATDVGLIVEAAVDGAFVGEYRLGGGDTIDIALYVAGQRERAIAEINQIPVHTPAGHVVTLASLVRTLDTTAPEQINRSERQRAVTLTINPPEAMALETVIRTVREQIEAPLRASRSIDPDVVITLTGNADKLAEARATMIGEWKGPNLDSLLNLLQSRSFQSVLVCYLVIVALYESWIYPFVIMFSVPLAIFGGFLGLWLCHNGTLLTTDQPVQQLDVLTFLGFIILVGTVVNNAILLVDQALQNLRLHGLSPHDAIVAAVKSRTRPVLMTSLTTVFGQLPLALMPGAGSELYRGLAAVMCGGMLVAAYGTLIVVPLMLSIAFLVKAPGAQSTSAGSAPGETGSTPTPS
ncbi:MAG: efflux RND transporter permease subunit [Phycisphaerales bacterium]|nr:efflux RND transporter permease subunit [Phycisphaerales bacterium]